MKSLRNEFDKLNKYINELKYLITSKFEPLLCWVSDKFKRYGRK